jgi:hypothetical protein
MAENKKLGYSVHMHGVLEPAIECPMGKYFVDMENDLYTFEPKNGDKNAEAIATIMAAIADHKGIAGGKAVGKLIENYGRLPLKKCQKKDDKYVYDFRIEGELEELVAFESLGSIYGNMENEVVYFKARHAKTFLAPLERAKAVECIKKDLKDPEKAEAADAILQILSNWTELDDDDIVE